MENESQIESRRPTGREIALGIGATTLAAALLALTITHFPRPAIAWELAANICNNTSLDCMYNTARTIGWASFGATEAVGVIHTMRNRPVA